MTEEQSLIKQLQEANSLLADELSEVKEKLDGMLGIRPFHDRRRPLPRLLCQLGAKLKRDDSTTNTMADECFTAAMEVVSMDKLVEYCHKSERAAHMELQHVADILKTTVDELPRIASKLMEASQTREFSPFELLRADSRTRNMIISAANAYGCATLSKVANLPDDNFLALQHCGPAMLRKLHTAFSFGDSEEI